MVLGVHPVRQPPASWPWSVRRSVNVNVLDLLAQAASPRTFIRYAMKLLFDHLHLVVTRSPLMVITWPSSKLMVWRLSPSLWTSLIYLLVWYHLLQFIQLIDHLYSSTLFNHRKRSFVKLYILIYWISVRWQWINPSIITVCSFLAFKHKYHYKHNFLGIRAIPSVGNTTTAGGVNSAILRYDGAPNVEPTSSPIPNPVILNESQLHVCCHKPHFSSVIFTDTLLEAAYQPGCCTPFL